MPPAPKLESKEERFAHFYLSLMSLGSFPQSAVLGPHSGLCISSTQFSSNHS